MISEPKLRVPGEFRVVRRELPDFVGDWRAMDYGDPHDERMAQLRGEFALESVVGGCATQFEGLLALKRWVRGRWDHGWSHRQVEVGDGLDILRHAAEGRRFCCGHYARVFADCARALGWPARLVGLSLADCEFPRDHTVQNVGHSVVEAWSDDHEKWVVLDPDLNVHYEHAGVPLSALEVRAAWLDGREAEVDMVQDEPAFVLPSAEAVEALRDIEWRADDPDEAACRLMFERFGRHRVMDYYARLTIAGWEWVDDRLLPTFIRHFSPAGRLRWTSNPADVYWSLNAVRLAAQPGWEDGRAWLGVTLEHCMPYFDHYEARVDGGDWERRDERFDWPMREGLNVLECRAVNSMNRPGIPARVEVAYARPVW